MFSVHPGGLFRIDDHAMYHPIRLCNYCLQTTVLFALLLHGTIRSRL